MPADAHQPGTLAAGEVDAEETRNLVERFFATAGRNQLRASVEECRMRKRTGIVEVE